MTDAQCQTKTLWAGLLGMNNALIARVTLGFIFLYHGLVPKILFLSHTEIGMIQAHRLDLPYEQIAVLGGVGEIILALIIIFIRSKTWPILVALLSLILLLIDVIVFSPHLLAEAFNPVTTNVAAIALCLIALSPSTQNSTGK